ncbi:hypothetical protein [Alicyclobacillus shizuokensis]|uniref:hypothetical protein n=1 Tax=Alicyclobacillus shizuokensis TaxID=392014 RepID=UPI000AF62246|nr:hypothetical protein [Alicyclobacillus shizuokensis]MCL6626059.1 hypothetical protein [Alicyclobacillus shizuokensis]
MSRAAGLLVTGLVLMLAGLVMVVQLRGFWEFIGIVLMVVPLFIGIGADMSQSSD